MFGIPYQFQQAHMEDPQPEEGVPHDHLNLNLNPLNLNGGNAVVPPPYNPHDPQQQQHPRLQMMMQQPVVVQQPHILRLPMQHQHRLMQMPIMQQQVLQAQETKYKISTSEDWAKAVEGGKVGHCEIINAGREWVVKYTDTQQEAHYQFTVGNENFPAFQTYCKSQGVVLEARVFVAQFKKKPVSQKLGF